MNRAKEIIRTRPPAQPRIGPSTPSIAHRTVDASIAHRIVENFIAHRVITAFDRSSDRRGL
jgi:hypothetical protein